MFDGLDHVWKTAQILASRDALLKDGLKEAAGELALALLQPEEWPTRLVTQVRSLREQLKGLTDLREWPTRNTCSSGVSVICIAQIASRRAQDKCNRNEHNEQRAERPTHPDCKEGDGAGDRSNGDGEADVRR